MPDVAHCHLLLLSSLNCHALRYTRTTSGGDLELGYPRLRHSRNGAAAITAAVSARRRWYLGGNI
jgi:hypothetical protein